MICSCTSNLISLLVTGHPLTIISYSHRDQNWYKDLLLTNSLISSKDLNLDLSFSSFHSLTKYGITLYSSIVCVLKFHISTLNIFLLTLKFCVASLGFEPRSRAYETLEVTIFSNSLRGRSRTQTCDRSVADHCLINLAILPIVFYRYYSYHIV